jgi:hypothetical protein
VVSEGLAVDRDRYELRRRQRRRHGERQAPGEIVAALQQVLEAHGARDRSVVEEHVEEATLAAGGVVTAEDPIRAFRVDAALGGVLPGTVREGTHATRLVRRQDRELHARIDQRLDRAGVDRSLRQPHAFRGTLEAMLELAQSPQNLRAAVALVGERQDHVVVRPGRWRCRARNARDAGAVGGDDALADLGMVALEPRRTASVRR